MDESAIEERTEHQEIKGITIKKQKYKTFTSLQTAIAMWEEGLNMEGGTNERREGRVRVGKDDRQVREHSTNTIDSTAEM